MIRTECSVCGVVSSNPTRGYAHVARHRKRRPSLQIHAQSVAENGGISVIGALPMSGDPPPDFLVCSPSCLGRGDQWNTTPCLCSCHYQGKSARRMSV